jgi:penicillin amidase
MEKDDAAPLIVALAYEHLRRAVAESAAPGKGASYQGVGTTAAIERLLRSRPAGWFRDWNEALLRALEDGLDEGSRRFGRDPARWKYGSYSGTALRHPLGARIPWYVEYPLKAGWLLRPWIPYANFTFDIDTFPQSGSSTTVKQTTQRMMPSMRMVVDFGDLEASLINLPTGQSGQIASEHYKDQFSAHYYGRSFRMQFDRVEAHRTLRLEPFSQTSSARKP